jgi:hypothetical protein
MEARRRAADRPPGAVQRQAADRPPGRMLRAVDEQRVAVRRQGRQVGGRRGEQPGPELRSLGEQLVEPWQGPRAGERLLARATLLAEP